MISAHAMRKPSKREISRKSEAPRQPVRLPEWGGAYDAADTMSRRPRLSNQEIEQHANKLLRDLWRERADLWPDREITPLDAIDPEIALGSIGFTIRSGTALDINTANGSVVEAWGMLDRAKKVVWISETLTSNARAFTLAHELGHALMHDELHQHRDRALDGSLTSTASDPLEAEANAFASCFLMPRKQVLAAFRQRFGAGFALDDDASFALEGVRLATFQHRYPTRRDVSHVLAATTRFGGATFDSLATHFKVSEKAMAIRLEQLGLT